MLYNNPHNSACVDFSPLEIAKLADEDVVHMVKSTYGTVEPVHDLMVLYCLALPFPFKTSISFF